MSEFRLNKTKPKLYSVLGDSVVRESFLNASIEMHLVQKAQMSFDLSSRTAI